MIDVTGGAGFMKNNTGTEETADDERSFTVERDGFTVVDGVLTSCENLYSDIVIPGTSASPLLATMYFLT
jgi:hypothetical protein